MTRDKGNTMAEIRASHVTPTTVSGEGSTRRAAILDAKALADRLGLRPVYGVEARRSLGQWHIETVVEPKDDQQ